MSSDDRRRSMRRALTPNLAFPRLQTVSTERFERLWLVDAAKGVVILLVVFHHSLQSIQASGLTTGLWEPTDVALTAVRMPTFFLFAGLTAVSVVSGSTRRFWLGRVLELGYILCLWFVLHLLYYSIGALTLGKSVREELLLRLNLATWDQVSPLWFLALLIVFLVTARLIRSVPVIFQISAAVSLTLFVSFFDIPTPWSRSWLFIFFVAGLYLARVPISYGSAHLSGSFIPGRIWLEWLGRHTLPIYLIHFPLLSAIWNFPGARRAFAAAPGLAPIPIFVLSLAGSLAIWIASRNVSWLYSAPWKASRRTE